MKPTIASAHRQIAYLVSQYPATSHTFILREVLGLRARGFDIHTVSINRDPRPLETITAEEAAERARTYYVKRHGAAGAVAAHAWALMRHPAGYLRGLRAACGRAATNPRRSLLHLFHFTEALMLGRWMARADLTHLHVHFATSAASVASLARDCFPIRLTMTVHGPDEFANVQREHFGDKIARVDLAICISHFARSQAMQHSHPAHWPKLEVVRLGVDPQRFAPANRPRDPKPFALLCVGRLTPAKGQHLLLEAMARLRDKGVPVTLTLVGDGPDRALLESRCQELGLAARVHFAGALNQDAVRPLYGQFDAFVLPSFAEGIPVVLMEAMASGLPCISTRIAGIPELIEDGENGLLVPASDVDGLCARILRLIEDPSLCERLRHSARRRICAEYDLEHNIGKLAELLDQRMQAA
jgi:glycosyltransferase involved in cell wall biosynthesis